jgi:hypothetical protein
VGHIFTTGLLRGKAVFLLFMWHLGPVSCYFIKLSELNLTVFLDLALCNHAEIDRRFRGAYCDSSDDGGSKHLCNVDQFLQDYTTQSPP